MRLIAVGLILVASTSLADEPTPGPAPTDACIRAAELGPAIIGFQQGTINLLQTAKPLCDMYTPKPAACSRLKTAASELQAVAQSFIDERKHAKELCAKSRGE